MKKLLLVLVLALGFALAQGWEYAQATVYRSDEINIAIEMPEKTVYKTGKPEGSVWQLVNAELNSQKGGAYGMLSALGRMGWELVSVRSELSGAVEIYVFKRPTP